jgi:UDP-galactopyranose mutase
MAVKTPALIVGAGPTGLSAAYHLGTDAMLVERNETVGGWCRSIVENGYTFDYAGHIMFSNDPYVHELYKLLLGDNVHWQDREAWIDTNGVLTRYPFQGALYGLPADVIKDCLLGAIEARFGTLDPAPRNGAANGGTSGAANGTPNGAHASNGTNGHAKHGTNGTNGHAKASIGDCCADGILEATARLGKPSPGASGETPARPAARNFEEFIQNVWGAGIARHFATPYNRKLWTVPLSEMETSWLGGRVPLPDLAEMIDGALRPVPKPMGPNARFGYPLRGGFQALVDGFLPHLARPPRLGCGLAQLSAGGHRARLDDGTEVHYDALVSTMPLPELVGLLHAEAPRDVREAADGLRRVSVRCVHVGVGRENLTDKHWIYYAGDTVFHRVFVQGNASPYCNPPGGFGLTCEITYSPTKPLPAEGDDLIRMCIEQLKQVGLIREDDPIEVATQTDLPYAYVVYDHGRAERVARLRAWLLERDIHLAGRYSEWEYYNSDHAFLAGRRVADEVKNASRVGRTPETLESAAGS